MRPLVSVNVSCDRDSLSCGRDSLAAMRSRRLAGLNVAAMTKALENVPHEERKNVIGGFIYHLVDMQQPFYASGKITGMLLELDEAELFRLVESPEALKLKVQEAVDVLGDWIPEQEKLLVQEAMDLQVFFPPKSKI
ncbi:unnamed protein product [Thlaspi arvense]|uniref:PABC domain-containing protein n=1 Tax=Thlaspi arvense TaxID=13288 RepID=A0AAU9RXX3_THLAR|nr:unnamed protein product [Thlaspi arvense]